MAATRLVFRVHALQRMVQRHISKAIIRHVLSTGEIIEDYPNDTPYPSRLILGWHDGHPIHVVAAENGADQETIIITVYEPDPRRWSADFRRRTP